MTNTDFDPFEDDVQQAQTANVAALDDDPETAARSIQLGQSTGVPPTAIYGDLEGFERQHKAALGGAIIGNNLHIADYLNSDPLAARLSHDDLGQLDTASQAIGNIPSKSVARRAIDSFKEGFGEFSDKAFLSDPFLRQPSDVEWALKNPELFSVMAGVGGLVGAPLTAASKIFSGGLKVVEEFGGREFAGFLEYLAMRGDIRSAPTANRVLGGQIAKEAAKLDIPVRAATPWVAAGKDVPVGVDATLDQIKIAQSKVDADALADALSESVKSTTRERSPEAYANFVRQHIGNQQIGISGDAVRELYGDKQPVPGDGILGWVPNIGERLTAAEATGGDVKVSLADWLANVDPEVAKSLHDHLRVRPEGITIDEGNVIKDRAAEKARFVEEAKSEGEAKVEGGDENVGPPSGPITEPLPLMRAHTASEPLFSIGDRKLKIERRPLTKADMGDIGDRIPADQFRLLDENGNKVGHLEVVPFDGGKRLYVDNILGFESMGFHPNDFGPALTRDLLRQLRTEYPNATEIGGFRISGAREKAGTEREVWVKFSQEGDITDAAAKQFKELLSEVWKQQGSGVATRTKPTELWTKRERQLSAAIKEELSRIAPGVGFEGVGEISHPDAIGRVSGVMLHDPIDGLPKVIVSLEHPQARGIGRHEAIHHLKNMGLFTQKDWDILARAARDNDWVKKYNIDERYGDIPQAAKLEEAIAEGYRHWKAGELLPKDTSVFQKMADFFDALHRRFKEILGRDFTWDELFEEVDTGRVGRRAPDSARGRAMLPKFSIEEPPGEGVPKLERNVVAKTMAITRANFDRYMRLIHKRHAEDLEVATRSAERQQRRTQTEEWKANRTEMRDEVREQIETRPDIAVDQMMAEEKIKFHPDSLTDEQKAMLPKEFVQKKNGLDPDAVAGFFGYHSGDAMVERLAMNVQDRVAAGMNAKQWREHLIDTETDRRMEERYGDLKQNILDEAKDQAISKTQVRLHHEETILIGQLAKKAFPFTLEDLRTQLRAIFDDIPLDSISSDEYLRIAGKAGKAVEEHLLREDAEAAFREKQRQTNATILASYAREYEKARRAFDRTAKTFRQREVASVPAAWTNWIHDLLLRSGNRINRSVQDLAENIGRQQETTLSDFRDAREAETFGKRELPIADFLLDPAFRKSMEELTAGEFAELKSAIDILAKQGRDEKKIYTAGEAADLAATLAEMRKKVQTFPKQLLPDEKGYIARKMESPKTFIAGLTSILTLLNRWDRADPRGIFNRYLGFPLSKAANTENVLQRRVAAALRELDPVKNPDKLVDSPFADPLTRTEQNPQGDPWRGFSRKHVLGMLAHAGNASNWRVLARGYSTDPAALMQWLIRNTTKEDWQQAQKRGDSIFKDLIREADIVKEHTTGATVEKIPLEPITNVHGTFDGWYHPLDADPLRKEVWVKDGKTGIWSRNPAGHRDRIYDKYGSSYATTADGYTKKRSGAVYPLDLDVTTMNRTIAQMIHDISFSETILEAQKVFSNRAFQAEVIKHYGAHYAELLMPFLRDMAGGRSDPGPTWKWAGEWSEYLRQNVISTYIGFNPYTAMKHGPTALWMSSREVGIRNFAPAFSKSLIERLVGDPVEKALRLVGADAYAKAVKGLYARSPDLALTMSEFAMKHSEELQRRERHWQDTIAGETKILEGASTIRERVIEKGSWLVAQSDMLSAKPTWIAEYNKRTAEGLSHGEAIDLADNAVRRAHGSTAATNQPALVRGGGPAHSWLTSVYGFMGTRMQRMIEIGHQLNDIHQLGMEGELAKAAARVPKLLADVMTYAIWPIMIEEAVVGLNTEDHRTGLQHLGNFLTLGMSSSVLYLRDIVHGLAGNHDPGVGLLSSAMHDVANAFRDLNRGKEAFSRQHAGKTVQDILTVLGEAKGVSPKTIANATRFGIDLVNKQQKPKTIGDYLRGISRGTSQRRVVK